MNYAEESCEISRRFGEGDDAITLILDGFQPGALFQMSLSGKPLVLLHRDGEMKVAFGNAYGIRAAFAAGDAATGEPALIFINAQRVGQMGASDGSMEHRMEQMLAVNAELESRITFLAFVSELKRPFLLETGSLGSPLASLRTCTQELTSHWGIDVERHRKLSRRAVPTSEPALWVRSSDYDPIWSRSGVSRLVYYRLIVDEAGGADECHPQVFSPEASAFANFTCDLIKKRAHFLPALDGDGKPLRSYFVGRYSIKFNAHGPLR